MHDFVQMLINGVAAGSTYALLGMAMVIIYKTSEVPNFAQGEMALIATYLAYQLLEQHGFSAWAAYPLALVFAAVLGAVLEFAVLRRAKDPNAIYGKGSGG